MHFHKTARYYDNSEYIFSHSFCILKKYINIILIIIIITIIILHNTVVGYLGKYENKNEEVYSAAFPFWKV